jgi:hypothetical protein
MADEPNLHRFRAELADAQAALTQFANGPARESAALVSDCFGKAGAKISGELERAARTGELSFKRLAKTVLEEFAKIALNQVLGPAPAPQRGAARDALTSAASALTVNFNLGAGADANSVHRNQAQIAAHVARAAAYGRRNQ